ncbi:hypothetical protein MMC30_004791 [Trapelia coarctata]|nr:hypothetical protein [Trapelia coarctata]
MPAQTSIPVAATVLGTIGTVFWCIQLVPQVWYNWKKKDTEGLPAMMMFLWVACPSPFINYQVLSKNYRTHIFAGAVPFGVYAVVQNFNIPIQIQPQVFCVLALVSWAQILTYSHKWKPWKATVAAVALGSLCGGLEVLLILTLRGPYDRGVTWPMILVGVVGAVLIGAGLIPPYWELWKRKGRVIGISPSPPTASSFKAPTHRTTDWIFLSIDSLGALFSLMALVAQETFDILGAALYLVVLVLELGIFTSHLIWRLRTRKLRKRAKLEGIKFDDLPEARKYQDHSRGDDSIELGTEGVGVEAAAQHAHAVSEVPWGEEGVAGANKKEMEVPRIGSRDSHAHGDGEVELDLERGDIGVAR